MFAIAGWLAGAVHDLRSSATRRQLGSLMSLRGIRREAVRRSSMSAMRRAVSSSLGARSLTLVIRPRVDSLPCRAFSNVISRSSSEVESSARNAAAGDPLVRNTVPSIFRSR